MAQPHTGRQFELHGLCPYHRKSFKIPPRYATVFLASLFLNFGALGFVYEVAFFILKTTAKKLKL